MLQFAFQRYCVTAMSGMALGLFASVIVSVLVAQLSKVPLRGFDTLTQFAAIINAKSPVTGAAIGVAIASSLKHKPLVVLSSAGTGAFGYLAGGPLAAYVAAVAGAEIGGLVSGRTRLDIVISPLATIIPGCLVGQLIGPSVGALMLSLGNLINAATELQPLPMGMVVAAVMGVVLTSPLSSAALAMTLDLNGLAAGAATVGCAAQMIGFAVISFRDNGWDGLFAQGLGSAKLQLGNIIRRPTIILPTTIVSAVLGGLATTVFGMRNVAQGAGMGTSGLVGQFTTYATMSVDRPGWQVITFIALLHFALPALLAPLADSLLRRLGWISDGDMRLPH